MKTTKGRRKVMLELESRQGAQVFVAGSFNDWNPEAKRLREKPGGKYEAIVMLPRGQHEYKFIVDGEWQIDQRNPHFTVNEIGTLNSVLDVA